MEEKEKLGGQREMGHLVLRLWAESFHFSGPSGSSSEIKNI